MRRRRFNNPGKAYGVALDRAAKSQAKLLRAFRAWERDVKALRRTERVLDSAQSELDAGGAS